MCDYSLHAVAFRPAKVGDKLVTTRFANTFTRGFSANELLRQYDTCVARERLLIALSASPYRGGSVEEAKVMNFLKCAGNMSVAGLLATALAHPAAAESANAVLKDANGRDVGTVFLSQTPAGVLLKLSLKEMPPGERAFHIHAVGKCEPPSFESAGPHFNPGNTHHGIMAGAGHAGDLPNLHIPPTGSLDIELVNAAITLDSGRSNSVFHPGGAAVVIHEGKDDYMTDPAGNAGNRIACGVIRQDPATVGRSPAR
jgi:superoxide dismutase, Cu-Zn family